MKILMSSYVFHPSIGGLETVSRLLSLEFERMGHEVVVVTRSKNQEPDAFPFRVVRRPSPLGFLKWVKWCDVFVHNNISLRMAWPLLAVRRPWVVAHHTWLPVSAGVRGLINRVKRRVVRNALSVSISDAVAADLEWPSVTIQNPYDDTIFHPNAAIARDRDLVFLGRLVSDKGVPGILEALILLRAGGVTPNLTIVGSGPEEPLLRQMVSGHGLSDNVTFMGPRHGEELADVLRQHRVLCVPSRWNEPFGIVALEAMACGCVVVGSEGGGLKQAIGPGGLTYPKGDIRALASCLLTALGKAEGFAADPNQVAAHLAAHRASAVAKLYVRVLERARDDR